MNYNLDFIKLGSIATIVTGKLDSNAAVEGGKYPYFTCSPKTLTINEYAFDQEAILLAGNNADGNYTAKYYNGRFNAYQRTYVISSKNSNKYLTQYLYYSINLALKRLKDISQGTTTKFLTKKILDDLLIPNMPIECQKQIIKLISSLEDKTNVNLKINANLGGVFVAS